MRLLVTGFVAFFIVTHLVPVSAQVSGNRSPQASSTDAVPVEIFQGPRLSGPPQLIPYPEDLRLHSKEGWVNVSFMVDPQGKPYELMVTDASGDAGFKKNALKLVSQWQFNPATLDGQAVDSAMEFKVIYAITGFGEGARPQFSKAYRDLFKYVNANDKAGADAAMRKLSVDNLYEDAYFGFAQSVYAQKWGTESEQLAGLSRAVAHENGARFLPKKQFIVALSAMLPLQVRARDFSGALQSFVKLQKLGADEALLATFKPTIDQINALKDNDRSFSVPGEIVDGSWCLPLFKRKFSVDVTSGHLSEVKLRCERKYVFFAFDPTLEYKVSEKYGACLLQLTGDPGTKFKLMQL
jgi:TonB family protein